MTLGTEFATIRLEGSYLSIYQITEDIKESWRWDARFENYQLLSKERIERIEKMAQYKLRKMPAKRLKKLRKSGQPGFILKKDGSYYYSKIDGKLHFFGHNGDTLCGEHRCSNCARLSDCEKVKKNASIESSEYDTFDTWHGNIEAYEFIKEGYETFNTRSNKLHVAECTNWEKMEPEEEKSGRSLAKIFEELEKLLQELYKKCKKK